MLLIAPYEKVHRAFPAANGELRKSEAALGPRAADEDEASSELLAPALIRCTTAAASDAATSKVSAGKVPLSSEVMKVDKVKTRSSGGSRRASWAASFCASYAAPRSESRKKSARAAHHVREPQSLS